MSHLLEKSLRVYNYKIILREYGRAQKSFIGVRPWNGLRFSGAPTLRTNPIFQFNFVSNEDECFKLLLFFYEFSYASDTISPSNFISDNGKTLVSKEKRFELGFFSPGSSKNRYVGIWYKNIAVRTVVWVANRINPINYSSGVLMINSTGSPVVVMRQNKTVVWSANSTKEAKSSVVLQLLNSGNLVLRDEQSSGDGLGSYLWQSFDYPCDTLLPEMKLGWDLKTGL
ncbi:hypothetical protein LWI28_016182 [Acer negundo]|uniref:Bulb-type lectin domain-containing protein n=1 Tax=Acer negundo TaxID=4023 RepID=A0AAD5J5Q8_ACENE|nr:hypothetical protein LWI28_016182 [Acer negundo]